MFDVKVIRSEITDGLSSTAVVLFINVDLQPFFNALMCDGQARDSPSENSNPLFRHSFYVDNRNKNCNSLRTVFLYPLVDPLLDAVVFPFALSFIDAADVEMDRTVAHEPIVVTYGFIIIGIPFVDAALHEA